jgi:uncharacterized protein with von Willebrand factor type A (vWA) domain
LSHTSRRHERRSRSISWVSSGVTSRRLTNITRELTRRDPDEALSRASARVQDWEGGTRTPSSPRCRRAPRSAAAARGVPGRRDRSRRRPAPYVFATRLTNITRELTRRDPDEALSRASARVQDWEYSAIEPEMSQSATIGGGRSRGARKARSIAPPARTRELTRRDPDEALSRASARVQDWEGGTRIAEALHAGAG